MNLASVRRYATGSAPFLGVPVLSLTEGKYITAVFKREHLQAAASCPYLHHASYDESIGVFVLTGDHRAEYRLNDLRVHKHWEVANLHLELAKWAESKRRVFKGHAVSKRAPGIIRAAKLQKMLARAERELGKIYARKPVSPLALTSYQLQPASESERAEWIAWREEHGIRQRLGWLAHRPRETWAKFYRDAEEIIGPGD